MVVNNPILPTVQVNALKHTAILFLLIITMTYAQENAGTSLAPSLYECYNNSDILIRDNRLPASINVLVELLRKIEIGNPAMNARELSIQLLHRFRQDGIANHAFGEIGNTYLIPYSPKRPDTYKFRIQLHKLTPGNAQTFNNDSLNLVERCSMHSIISETIELTERGDESRVCNAISRYTRRIRRENEITERVAPPTFIHSTCPIESGVIYDRWGTFKLAPLISGLATGFEQMMVPTYDNNKIDNRYAATLIGELAEAALYQTSRDTVKVGSNGGGWNTTVVPRYYFIQDQERFDVTDAEIRGGLDGLLLALNLDGVHAKFSNIKLSQLVDMYYSTRGVFNTTLRACNRRKLAETMLPTDKLIQEIVGFMHLLNLEATMPFSVIPDSYANLATRTVNAYQTYIGSLNDLDCGNNATQSRVATELVVFVDTARDQRAIYRTISAILDEIDVNRFDTSYVIYAGGAGDIIINNTNSILDIHENYTLNTHAQYGTGFDYKNIYSLIEHYGKNKLENKTAVELGKSAIFLLVPHNTPGDDDVRNSINNKMDYFKRNLPDLKIMALITGNKNDYSALVTNSDSDLFVYNDNLDDNTIKSVAKLVVERIKQVHRPIINPNCGSNYYVDTWSSFIINQYIEPTTIIYYRISPNYFYVGSDDNRVLKITGTTHGNIEICMSRNDIYPSSSSTDSDCKQLTSDTITYDLQGYCDGSSVIDCLPIYLSVQGLTSNIRCTETTCRYPDSIKFTIEIDNVGCVSAANQHLISIIFITIMVCLWIY